MWRVVVPLRWLLVLPSLGLACSCAQDPREREHQREHQREEQRAAEAKKPPSRRGPVATLTGQVALAVGTQLPEYAPFDLSRTPLNSTPTGETPPNCAASLEAARRPVQLTAAGFLSGVVLAASDFTRVKERPPRVHKVWIENCRLRPAVVAATGGDTLQLINTDDFEFEPLLGPTYEARGLAPGENVIFPLVPGGIDSLLCSPRASCGRSDIVVFFHPVHAVTDEDGTFRMTNFPAAENVRLTAWHPLFEPSETFVWLNPGETSTVTLVMTPKQRFVPKPQIPTAAAAPR